MLEIRDLHVKFHTRDREAVAGLSLSIQDGEIVGLVGESGSGKSVTAMSVAGLLPRAITPARFCWTAGSCCTSPGLSCEKSRAGRSAWYFKSR